MIFLKTIIFEDFGFSLFLQGRGNKEALQLFGEKRIRTAWNQEEEKWYFSIVDVCAALTDSVDAAAYWRKLKERLRKEGNETVTNCHAFKMRAADGKMRQTDVADQQLFCPVNSRSNDVMSSRCVKCKRLSDSELSKTLPLKTPEAFCIIG